MVKAKPEKEDGSGMVDLTEKRASTAASGKEEVDGAGLLLSPRADLGDADDE